MGVRTPHSEQNTVSEPRAVRIPRTASPDDRPSPLPGVLPTSGTFRANRAGTQRAVRLAVLYAVGLAVLYGLLVLLDRSAPGGGGSGATAGLELFSAIAALLGAGGVLFALSQAPRGVEIGETATVVVGRWARRRSFPPLAAAGAHLVRRFPASFLSDAPVVVVELTSLSGRRSTFLLEEGLLPAAEPRPTP